MLASSLVFVLCLVVHAQSSDATTTLAPGNQNQCCFVIQDKLSVNYWAHYFTSTWTGLRKVTSVIATVSQYADTAVTNYETKTLLKNSTLTTSWEVAENWVYASNAAPGPKLVATVINASITTVHGSAVTSPAGFFVYPSVKVIHVPAITQDNGELACTTRSTYFLNCSGPAVESATFTGINSYAQAYFGGLNSTTQTATDTFTRSQWSRIPVGTSTSQVQITNQTTFTMTRTDTVTNITRASTTFSTTEIQFPTPYLHFPERGRTEVIYTGDLPKIVGYSSSTAGLEAREVPTKTSSQGFDPLLVDYGYIPQIAINYLAEHHPSLASCLPGGPSILPIEDHHGFITIHGDGCGMAAPAVQEPVADLFESSGVTVQATGCLNPINCKVTAASDTKSELPMVELVQTPVSDLSHPSDVPFQYANCFHPGKCDLEALPKSTTLPSATSRKAAAAAPSTQIKAPSESSATKPNLLSFLFPAFGASSHISTLSQGNSFYFNPTETATPMTGSASAEVTAGGYGSGTIRFPSSLNLPAIVMEAPAVDSSASSFAVEVAGHTLTSDSSAITISGFSVSLGSAGLVVGTSTLPLSTPIEVTATTQRTQGLGDIILGAFGPHESTVGSKPSSVTSNSTTTDSLSPAAFTGGAATNSLGLKKGVGALVLMAAWHVLTLGLV